MRKKNHNIVFIVFLIIILVVMVGFCVVFYQKQQEKQEQLNALVQEARPYETEANQLKMELNSIENGSEVYDRYLAYGYYITSIDEIDSTDGAIVLDNTADEELIEAAVDSGRELVFIYDEGLSIDEHCDLLVIRTTNSSEVNLEGVDCNLSYHIDESTASVLENGFVNIPYIYCKSDDYDIRNRLNSFNGALFVIFNTDVVNNVTIMNSYNTYEITSIEVIKEHIIENKISSDAEKSIRIQEINDRLAELETIIEDIYSKNSQN